MVRPLDVLWIYDATVEPPKMKMMAAIDPQAGFFYRINTRPWRPAVKLVRDPDHLFLDHDSFLECGDPLEIDDSLVDEALRRRGVVGQIAHSVVPEIRSMLLRARHLSRSDRDRIVAILDSIILPS